MGTIYHIVLRRIQKLLGEFNFGLQRINTTTQFRIFYFTVSHMITLFMSMG
jgi:hypothetical protein